MRIRSLAPGSATPSCPRPRLTLLALPLLLASLVGCKYAEKYLPPDEGKDPVPVLDPEGKNLSGQRKDRVEQVDLEDGWVHTELANFEAFQSPQRKPVWCWAACTEMILGYDGMPASQEEIANRVHGYVEATGESEDSTKVRTASYWQLLHALAPEAPRSDFEAVWSGLEVQARDMIEAQPASFGSARLDVDKSKLAVALIEQNVKKTTAPILELLGGHPAIVGLEFDEYPDMGHAYVFIGAVHKMPKKGILEQGVDLFNDYINLRELIGLARHDVDYDPYVVDAAIRNNDRMNEVCPVQEVVLIDPDEADDPATPENEMRIVMPYEEFHRRVYFVTTRVDALAALCGLEGTVEVKAR